MDNDILNAALAWVQDKAESEPDQRIAIVAPSSASVRDIYVPWLLDPGVRYYPSRRMMEWENGSKVFFYLSYEGGRLRGPQFHYGLALDVARWKDSEDTLDNLKMGVRLGENPIVRVLL